MVVVLAKIPVKPEKREEFIEKAQHAIVCSRKEAGNISYVLYKSTDNDSDVMYVEEWDSWEALAAHGKAEHLLAFREARKDLLAGESTVKKYEVVGK